MKFQKGRPRTGGRQPGTQNKTTETIKELSLGLVQDLDYVASLKKRMISGRSPQLEILMHFYAYGKPKTEITTDKTITVIIQRDGHGTGPRPVIDAQRTLPDHSTDHGG